MDILDQIAEEANKNQVQDTTTTTDNSVSPTTVEVPQESTQEQPQVVETNNPAEENNTATQTEKVADVQTENPKSVFASDKVAELNAYLAKNPTKDISDWQKLKTPTSELDQQDLLRQYYSEKEGLTEKEIEYKLKQMEVDMVDDDFVDDFGDDTKRLKREAELERELRNAREWREAYVSEQLSGGTDSEQTQPQQTITADEIQKQWAEAQEKSRAEYLQNVYKVLPEMQTIDLDINGEKVSYVPDEEFISSSKLVAEQPETLWQNFQNPDGSIKDAKGWVEMLNWANPVTREKMIAYRVQQEILRYKAQNDSQKRNVSADLNTGTAAQGSVDDEFAAWYNEQRRNQF